MLFLVLYDSSLRISEAVNLDVMDIDLMMKQIILPADKAKDRRYRTIPISNRTVQLLIKLIDENKKVFKDAEAVFLNWYGERMAVDTFRRNLKRYLKRLESIMNTVVMISEDKLLQTCLRMVLQYLWYKQ